jgi:hypothetical protein
MIFELRNKTPHNSPFLRSEDVLTSTTFGNLRYFSGQGILMDFLNESIDLNNTKLHIVNDDVFEINFWEKHYNDNTRRYNETDLTLKNNNYIIIIECKYHSPLGEEYQVIENQETNYSNQLIRYSKILLDKKYVNYKKIVIYLTEDKTIPIEVLSKSRNGIDGKIGLYWLSWNKLYLALIKQNINKLPPNELLLYNDLIAFLRKRNLITFDGFITENTVCHFHYRKQYKYVNMHYDNTWHYRKCYSYIGQTAKLSWRYKK